MNTKPGVRQSGKGRRFSGTALAIWALLVGLAGGCSPAATHYREHHDVKSLCTVLSRQVKRGDSMQGIQKLLGPGLVLRGVDRDRAAAHYLELGRTRPKAFPDGVQGDDVFLGYQGEGISLALQFRNGRLTNYDPKEFKRVPEVPAPAS